MRAIAGAGHVSNEFVNYDPPGTPNGTVYTAEWGNDVQDELIGIQGEFSIAEAAGTNAYVLAAIKGIAQSHGKRVGELFFQNDYEAPAAFDKDNPDDFFPALCLSAIDGHTDISTTNWALLVPYLRAQPLRYLQGKAGATTAFDVTSWAISSNVATLTFANTDPENDVLAALAEDQLVEGGYTNWRTVTLASAIGSITAGDYAITDVDTAARTIEFAFTASNGSGAVTATVNFYPHRIAGSTTTARVFEVNGRTLVSAGDADGEAFAGLLRRDRTQGHDHFLFQDGSASTITISSQPDYAARVAGSVGGAGDNQYTMAGASGAANRGRTNTFPIADASNGTPRIGATTDPRAMIGHLYIHGRSYAA